MKTPDILNSKIKKIRIELPHYSFSHSSSGDSPHTFIGRERIREKLKKVVEDSPDEPGVYLVAGNRGVGKTSYVNEVIKETSLQPKSKFIENFKYSFLLFLVVAGIYVFLKKFPFCIERFLPFLQIKPNFIKTFWNWVIYLILIVPTFITLCRHNGYRRKILKQKHSILGRIWNYIKSGFNCIKFAIKELSYLIHPHIQYGKTQYVLKIVLVVCYTQIISLFNPDVTPTKVFVFYLCFVFNCMFLRYIRVKLRKYYIKYKKDKLSNKNIYDIEHKWFILLIDKLFKLTSFMLLFLPLFNNYINNYNIYKLLIIFVPFFIIFIRVCFWCCKYLKKGIRFVCIIQIIFRDTIFIPIKNYIKNHNRLYLRINFGHKLKDEKDILRLITRTLSTEYNKYHHSFRRMLPRRVMTFVIIFLFACLLTNIVRRQEFYKSIENIVEKQEQEFNKIFKDEEKIKDIFSTVGSRTENTLETKEDNTVITNTIKIKKSAKVGLKVNIILYSLDQLVLDISKIIENIPRYLWNGKNKNIEFSIDYLFWLSFFLIYLFSKLIFRCTWITHFFVTHQIITRRLKKLNSDITHRTELENSISVNSENAGPGIKSRIKKIRNIADAREIEKELQDILSDIQRIPVIMCRPNIVIVFDELDKVEPGDTGMENELPQTKASMFSINATRERQTEILRILSNMKYFLSTARAKFIFIAGREMFDIHLADVSERNNYIGSIFNAVILVPSFLTDHHTGKKTLPQESSIASLTEEFVCRRLIPYDYPVESYDLKNYKDYLKREKFCVNTQKKEEEIEQISKIIAVIQQFIIYLAHVSKGAPKKMIQLFESFIEIYIERDKNREDDNLVVQCYHNSRYFLSFNYYKQYTLGIIAYLITPIFYRLAESNVKEHSDKLLVSSLRFVDFLFKFHKHSFSWKILNISPEMQEVNRAPELKSVVVDLLNYLTQVHINKSNFNLSDYKFDGLIANEIFAMAKTDEVFSALFSFSLDEMLPLKKHYLDLLEKTKKLYKNKKKSSEFIDAISSLQVVLGDIYYYDDGLEEAESYYKSAVQVFRKNKKDKKITFEQFYVYVRNMLRLGMIYEKRKQYDFAYLTYGEICERIIKERDIKISSLQPTFFRKFLFNTNDMLFKKIAFEGLKILYLPFIAKLQILELSHIGGITRNHLEQLDNEIISLTYNINHKEAKLLEAEFHSRVADILYYKNSDLKCYKGKNRKDGEDNCSEDTMILPENTSCTACSYYHKALSILLNLDKPEDKEKDTVIELLCLCVKQLYNKEKQFSNNYNMKYCTILARILSDWGNVFFSCDINETKENGKYDSEKNKCYICDGKDCNTISKKISDKLLNNCINYIESDENNTEIFFTEIKQLKTKRDIAFAMYSISSVAYRNANLYKRSSFQIYKTLCLFKHYKIYKNDQSENYIEQLTKNAIHYLWYANEDLNVLELNKRKKDFDKYNIKKEISLQNLLLDSEFTRIWTFVKKIELKLTDNPEKLKAFYDMNITSPYKINYSIEERIYRLWLKLKVNYKAYKILINNKDNENDNTNKNELETNINIILDENYCNENAKEIFGNYFNFDNETKAKIEILENLIAESIYCLIDIAQLIETMDETFVFTHSFMGSIHKHLSYWIRLYETYEIYKKKNPDINKVSRIDHYLKKYLDEEWREQLSGYRENQRALSHYYKCLEIHNEGRAYHNMIDTMVYLRDDYNDRLDHFNIAEERHLIVNGKIEKKINAIKNLYEDSKLYNVENYYNEVEQDECR